METQSVTVSQEQRTEEGATTARRPVLVATDLGEGARAATAWAHTVTQCTEQPAIATHIIEPRFGGILAGRFEPQISDARVEGIRGLMDIWYKETTGATPSDTEVCSGPTSTALERIAADRDAAMMVMSRTGRGTLQQALLGSRVQQVAQNPPCPLVVVHPHGPLARRGMHVAVATDFSEAGNAAMRFAAWIAEAMDGKLSILHSTYIPASRYGGPDDEQEAALATITDLCHRELELQRAAVWSDHLDLEIDLHVLTGRPDDALIEFDQEHAVDLMVVGQTGHTSPMGALLGSVPRRLLQHTSGHLAIVPKF